MTTTYGLTKYSPRADTRRLIVAFDGVRILSLPNMAEEGDGTRRPAWLRITPGSHGDDSIVKMETAGKRYAPATRWNPEAHRRELIPDAPRWGGRIVLYATARWQAGDVVRVELWESEVNGEIREFWRIVWTATPHTAGRELVWLEAPAADDAWGWIADLPDQYPLVRTVEGGPDDARMRGALMVVEPDNGSTYEDREDAEDVPPQRIFGVDVPAE